VQFVLKFLSNNIDKIIKVNYKYARGEFMGKYTELTGYLITLETNEKTLTFKEIEEIIGTNLCKAAKTWAVWWHPNGHPHAEEWAANGWYARPNINNSTVCFEKRNKKENILDKKMYNNIKPKKTREDIILPSPNEVEKYLDRWNNLENYVLQESSLKKLFQTTYKENINMDDVLIKVCALNDFYSINIYSPFKVAKHIVNLNIDKRLLNNDLTLVNEIESVKTDDNKIIHFYSFATKYCSHHKPLIYPIYDDYVKKILEYLNSVIQFYNNKKLDFKNYINYVDIINKFKEYFHLEKYNVKEIDRYLWQAGKEYFPKNYKKKNN
jgi:hypothetical protein